ncbi:RNA polymerase sigma-70 factor (ECF subfamily) [Mucilaginibacter gracilis]|uniref:RNA polymerase sigma-70 factor (ECF subfamily) n=1 Tax=Mucilaginibacter gracilis TaxID=423350 RepID=A0A495J044_9SPHI|nr:RNA polymerase sigma-70 factor [Mucilaginibacter gracilis]RKR81459.1 RNA polymerase sigma-70 factor (ECF subfamily) [Mucilaginibacter gracilis]
MNRVRTIDEQTDFRYLDGIRQGDHSSFTELYRKYFQGLVLASDKYVKEIDVAKEIVQDVFLKMWEHAFELDHVVSLKSYLYRTVINASLNHLKREKNINQHHLKIADEVTYDSIDDVQAEQELKILIFKEIENLPGQCKKVFKMSRFDGLKYREIAVLLEISEKTVENHMVRALKILREKLYDKDSKDNSYKLKIFHLLFASAPGLISLEKFI